jgi:hypothetical protein
MRRVPTAALLATIALGAGGDAAQASTTSTAGLGFTAAAANSDSWFIVDAKAGQVAHRSVRLRNLTGRVKRLRLATTDASTAANGGFAFAAGAPRANGRWVELSRRTVTLAPRAQTSVDFAIRVPAGAAGGEHYAGITVVDAARLRELAAARSASRQRFMVQMLSRTAIAVQVNLPSRPLRRLAQTSADVAALPSGPVVALGLSNTGNRLVKTTAVELDVTRDGKRVLRSRTALGSFVTESDLRYLVPWRGELRPGRYHLRGWLRPQGATPTRLDSVINVKDKTVERAARQPAVKVATGSAIPLAIWIALGSAFTLVLAMAYALLRSRRRAPR